jgi:hypothetical protein
MTNETIEQPKGKTVEQEVRAQIKEEVGEDELNHKQKSVIFQKYGIWDMVISIEELAFWEAR